MRKKRVILALMAAAWLAGVPGEAAVKGRWFSLGLSAGGGPAGSNEPTWRTGVEIGFRFLDQWTFAAGISYGKLVRETTSLLSNYRSSDIQTWKDWPLSLMIRYAAPLADRAAVSLGAGVACHNLVQALASETNISGDQTIYSQEAHFQAWAPQAEIGLEIAVGQAWALTGTVQYEFGIARLNSSVSQLDVRQDLAFGGVSLLLGVRFRPF